MGDFYKKSRAQEYLAKDCCLGWVSIGLFIWIYIWASRAKDSIAQEVGGIESLLQNWRADFITDIQFSSSGACPSGYEESFVGSWAGTDYGCDCLGIYCHRDGVADNTLAKGGCNRNETICGCDNVRVRQKTKLHQVPSHDYVCIQRATGLNFIELYNFMDEQGVCKDGYKACGDINGKSKGICIPTAETCPITGIVFGTTNPNPGTFDQTVAGTGISAYFTRGNVQQPWIDTEFSESHRCYDIGAISISQGRKNYVLMS
jgi:hypothetical protein